MALGQGDALPKVAVKVMGEKGPEDLNIGEFAADKKVVIFAVPGAFTPTCSNQHLPSYLKNYDQIKSKGFDTIACMAVNDAFVMKAWGADRGVGDKIMMLADGNGDYTKALGLELDATGFGLGTRGKRFSIVVNDGVAEQVNIDEGGYDLTSAEKTCGI